MLVPTLLLVGAVAAQAQRPKGKVRRQKIDLSELAPRPENLPLLAKAIQHTALADEAADVMVKIGPPAIPVLLEALKETNGVVDAEAARALARMGAKAEPAIPILIVAMKRKNLKMVAVIIETLEKIGDASIPKLIEGLRDPEPRGREMCARALANFGPRAHEAVPRLVALLHNTKEDRMVRFWAAAALGEMGGHAVPAIPYLIEALDTMEVRDRSIVARSLGRMGPHAKPAIPRLVRMIKAREGAYNVDAAARALASIGPPAVPVLLELAGQDENRRLKNLALESLRQVGIAGVPRFVEVLTGNDRELRREIGQILVEIGEPAAPHLFPLLTHRNPRVRQEVAYLLSEIPAAAVAAVPVLIEHLQHSDPERRFEAVARLATIGPEAAVAIAPLIEALEIDPQDKALAGLPPERQRRYLLQIAQALVAIGEPAVPDVSQALLSDSKDVRDFCSLALAHLAQENATALEALVAISMNEEHPRAADQVVWALSRMPPKGRDLADLGSGAVPGLLKMLSEGEERLRESAGEGLAIIGRPAIPGLLKILFSDQLEMRTRAVTVLGLIGSRAADTSPYVYQALDIERELMKSEDHPTDEFKTFVSRVAETVYRFGYAAIPVSIKALEIDNPTVQTVAGLALAQHGYRAKDAVRNLMDALQVKDYRVRFAAAQALGAIGSPASGAVPSLIESIREEDEGFSIRRAPEHAWEAYRSTVVRTLQLIGDDGALIVLRTLIDEKPDSEIRDHLVAALLLIEADEDVYAELEKERWPDLIELLEDEDMPTRLVAIDAVSSLGEEAEHTIPDLLNAAAKRTDDDLDEDELRRLANQYPRRLVDALARFGDAATPVLYEAWEHENEDIRDTARDALRRIAPQPETILAMPESGLPLMIDAFDRPQTRFGKNAAEAIVMLGPEAIPTLIDLYGSDRFAVQQAAVMALSRLYENGALELTKMLEDSDPNLRALAARALGGPRPAPRGYIPVSVVVPALKKAMEDESKPVRRYAARSLQWLDPKAAEAAGAAEVIRKLEVKPDPLERLKQRLREERAQREAEKEKKTRSTAARD